MRSLTVCLISLMSFCYNIMKFTTGDQAPTGCSNMVIYKGINTRRYIQGGIAVAECADPLLGQESYLTINGKKVTDRKSSASYYDTTLNRSTELGEYRSNKGNTSVLMFRITYILCDPGQVAPEKVCGKGQFCVINGTSTRCQQRLDCESTNSRVIECENGKALRNSNSSCSVYNNAKEIPQGYYLTLSRTGTTCASEPHVFYKGQKVQYLSTIAISDSRDVESNAWNKTRRNMSCYIGSGHVKPGHGFDLTSNPNITWPESLPAKKYIKCVALGKMKAGATGFHILFYEKSTRFSIMQKKTNTRIDLRNITKPEIWLDSPPPYYCSVSVPAGLFVKALRTEADSPGEPQLGEDSVELELKKERSTSYACWAVVYFYEQMADQGFKELYREKREIVIRLNATSSKGSSQAVVVGGAITAAVLTVGLLIGAALGVRAYRKRSNQTNQVQEKVPFRSVRAPETDQFKSMTADRSASVVSASGLQPSQGAGFTSLFYKQKPKSGKRTGPQGTRDSHRRRSSQVIEKGMPNNVRRGTGPIGLKLESHERAGSQGTASSHRRRSSQVTDTGSRKSGRAGSIEPEAESATGI